jgi:hypothetical protein
MTDYSSEVQSFARRRRDVVNRHTNTGDHVLLARPFIVDAPFIDTIVERLGEAIDAATREMD